ncbi:MAG TPA: hypothetical protein VN922_03025 [Bacteroidia bacterium]|nr:hypothetical protein [Bacteroidia bacterium]
MKTKGIITKFFLALFTITFSASFGQETAPQPVATIQPTSWAFSKGTNVINAGVGIGGYYSYWGGGYYETPNFILSYENGTFGNVGPGTISLGALFSYKGISDNYIGSDGYNYTDTWAYWILGFRSAYHLNVPDAPRFDPYAGLMLGYYFLNHTFSTNNPDYMHPGNPGYVYYSASYPNYAALGLFVGARYYLSNAVGVWGELGYGYTTLAIGVNFKI